MNNPLSSYTLQCQCPLRQGWYRVSGPGLGVLTSAPAPSEARDSVTQSRRHGGDTRGETQSYSYQLLRNSITK